MLFSVRRGCFLNHKQAELLTLPDGVRDPVIGMYQALCCRSYTISLTFKATLGNRHTPSSKMRRQVRPIRADQGITGSQVSEPHPVGAVTLASAGCI